MEDGYHVADDYRPDMPKPIKAVGYIRVSTKQQAGEDRMGQEAQKQAIEKYAEENNYKILHWYTDEVSGVSEEREALNDILFGDDLDEAGVRAVITYKSDRIARDIKLYFYYLFLLEKRKIKLVSINERFDDDEYGLSNVFRSLMLFVAEQERKNILMRTSSGRRVKAEQGGYAGGKPPYGYGVFNRCKHTVSLSAYSVSGGVGSEQFRIFFFYCDKLVKKSVIFEVLNFRLVHFVITLVVVVDYFTKLFTSFFHIFKIIHCSYLFLSECRSETRI